jgi:formylglycine-generating enzyme required for sulfatase activity
MTGWQDGYPYSSPVGAFPAGDSPYGLTDMAGNVREWVVSETETREGEFTARGASWRSRDFEMKAANRHIWKTGVSMDDLGVRCVADVP